MSIRPAFQRNGFTLVELLVALFVFSLIAVAGVGLLRTSADGQLALKDRLSVIALNSRSANLLETDLAQAVARPVRDSAGLDVSVFATRITDIDGLLFAFVRGGGSGASEDPAISRVAYSFAGGELRRTSWPRLDGAEAAEAAVLASGIGSVTPRFRDLRGKWRNDWTPADPMMMPRAVELTIMPERGAPYRLVLLVGSQQRPPETPAAGGGGNAP